MKYPSVRHDVTGGHLVKYFTDDNTDTCGRYCRSGRSRITVIDVQNTRFPDTLFYYVHVEAEPLVRDRALAIFLAKPISHQQ